MSDMIAPLRTANNNDDIFVCFKVCPSLVKSLYQVTFCVFGVLLS